MISPKWIFSGAIITSFLMSIFLYNLTASAFSNPINIQGKTYENDNKNNQTTSQSINGTDSQIIANNILEDSSCLVSNRFPQDILRWCELITQNAIEQGLDANLLAALILQESAGDPLAYSHSGAVGLMQVMPRDGIASNFICKNGPCFTDRPPIEDLQKPDFNIAYGSNMLSNLLSRHGSVREALKSYGPMDVGYEYSDIVINLYNSYKN